MIKQENLRELENINVDDVNSDEDEEDDEEEDEEKVDTDWGYEILDKYALSFLRTLFTAAEKRVVDLTINSLRINLNCLKTT